MKVPALKIYESPAAILAVKCPLKCDSNTIDRRNPRNSPPSFARTMVTLHLRARARHFVAIIRGDKRRRAFRRAFHEICTILRNEAWPRSTLAWRGRNRPRRFPFKCTNARWNFCEGLNIRGRERGYDGRRGKRGKFPAKALILPSCHRI